MGGATVTTHVQVMALTSVLTSVTARSKADAVLASVAHMYAEEIEAGLYPAPTLSEDAYGSQFAIAWEDGPYEWAFRLQGQPDRELELLAIDAGIDAADARKLAVTADVMIPDGVEVEPYYSFVLCVEVYG